MCRGIVYFVIACSLAVGAFAQDSTDASYSGTWLLQNNSGTKLILEQHEDQIRVREVNSSGTLVDYTCNTLGKECEIKDDGHKAKVSLWFNGFQCVTLSIDRQTPVPNCCSVQGELGPNCTLSPQPMYVSS